MTVTIHVSCMFHQLLLEGLKNLASHNFTATQLYSEDSGNMWWDTVICPGYSTLSLSTPQLIFCVSVYA